ncbi:MAG: LapD/MoxY N-terminal periplasmic domain-containing protein [Polaromonas sp.]|uniref:bifunctional diguanylate cyclase/phosphodiesterase n=1 Tax=Polaromonas sp. TaxID=1869339 RepID=UPI002734A937|nr:LapD/MoxY N-terminal periplasmic domain-containing protein [Polaromonas sp.]MDP2817173.1 LapD/MoxY N-terminal periplasmic domain-containing protein [Polaromonas sp.]
MSMYRQMWLAIILSTLLALMGGLLASTLNARSYLSEQLNAKNTDNATALALALSQQNADAVMIELAVSALFDSGHYELIRVVDPLGKTIVERVAPANGQFVPDWFVKALPLRATPGQAQISNGWNQLGTLTVVSASRFAYQSLWKSVLQLTLALGLSGFVGGYLGTLILRRLREPLQRVINQASAISERRFVSIDLPDVPELRQLALAMNSTVSRLKDMFAEEAQRLEVLRVTANYDPLTGLPNRTFFLVQLLDLLDSEEAAGGHLLLVRLAGFSELNQLLGLPATNQLLKAIAEVLHQQQIQTHGVAARIGDSDFVLLLPSPSNAHEAAKDLMHALAEASAPFTGTAPVAHIGIGKLKRGQDIANLLAQAASALAMAEAQGTNAIRESSGIDDGNMSSSAEETAQLIGRALEQGRVRLASFPVLDFTGKLVHRECPLEVMLDEADGWQPINRFLQLAEHFQLTPLIDLTTLNLGLEELHKNPSLPGVAISLSAPSLREDSFRLRLLELIRKTPGLAARLWLEVPEADVLKHTLILPVFIADVKKTGSRIGLTQFGRHFSHSDTLHDFGLDFLKVDSSFIRGLQYSTDNQTFLKGLASVAHKMDIQVFGEGVIDRAELAALDAAGFDGVAGPAVKETD